MKLALLCVSLAILAATSMTEAAVPYLGLDLHSVSPTGDFRGTNVLQYEGGAKWGPGLGIDAGLTGKLGDIYLGWSLARHDASAGAHNNYVSMDIAGTWTVNRAVLGMRIHDFGKSFSVIKPVVGAGLTLGTARMKASATGRMFGQRSDTTTAETSDFSLGFFGEAGLKLRMGEYSDLLATVQYHSYDASYDNSIYSGSFTISHYTFVLGLIYRLK
jgi:hypothetical protein